MKLPRKIGSFLGMSGADRLLVCEAIVLLGLSRIIVLTVPFRVMAHWLERAAQKTVPAIDDAALLASIRRAVMTAARNVPWNAVCLPQAMAAKAMLARRGCGSSFHLGAGFDGQGKLIAHAWLTVGDLVVVGAAGTSGITPLVRFG